MREVLLLEEKAIKAAVPYDMDTVTTLPRVSMAKGDRVAIVCNMGDSVGAVVDFTINQHTLATGGSSKVLATLNPYFKKAGAATAFTKVQPETEVSNYVLSTDFAAQEGVVVFEVLGEDLDNENGFEFISISAADSTTAKILSVTYIVGNLRNSPGYSIDL